MFEEYSEDRSDAADWLQATAIDRWTTSAVNFAVSQLQPWPAMAHTELHVPGRGENVWIFATYRGIDEGDNKGAGWQQRREEQTDDKLWRAVPIFLPTGVTTDDVGAACDQHVGTPYSTLKYALSAPPFRAFARFDGNGTQSPTHCAALSARCINSFPQGPKKILKNHPSWYGPSTLYLELTERDTHEQYWKAHNSHFDSILGPQRTSPNNDEAGALHQAVARVVQAIKDGDDAKEKTQHELAKMVFKTAPVSAAGTGSCV
jgi:hypothetical protein